MWQTAGNIPLAYQVNNFDIDVQLEGSIRVPQTALDRPPNQYEAFGSGEQQRLRTTVDEMGIFAFRAFEYWLRLLRWKTGIGYIGEPSVMYAASNNGGTALRERATGRRFWVQGGSVIVQGNHPVNLAGWEATQTALSAERAPPVWFDFLFDGEMRINNKDLVGAVLSLAIAFETNVRTIFSQELSKATVEPALLEILDQANLRALLNRLRKLQYWNKDWEAASDFSKFNSLMNYRDRVMHSAETKNLDSAELQNIQKALKKFAYFTCEALALN